MARYILIDHNSGYIWGDTGDLNGPARQETPAEAALRLDEDNKEFGREYEEHGANYRPNSGESAYHVYRADIDGSEAVPLVYDGQSRDEIEAVERLCRKIAVVTSR
jgi:hypothetical protein